MNIEQHKANRRRQLQQERARERIEIRNHLVSFLGDSLEGSSVEFTLENLPILHYEGHDPIEVHIDPMGKSTDIWFRVGKHRHDCFADALIAAERQHEMGGARLILFVALGGIIVLSTAAFFLLKH